MHTLESIWTKTVDHSPYPSLGRSLSVDVAIVGGGLAGILTAYFLKNSGLTVAILEQDHIGHGKTGHIPDQCAVRRQGPRRGLGRRQGASPASGRGCLPGQRSWLAL